MSENLTNFENYSNEMNGLENGSNINPLKNDSEELKQDEKQKVADRRFNLYYSKRKPEKKTEKYPNVEQEELRTNIPNLDDQVAFRITFYFYRL
ncbi:hypothetical protein KKB43_01575 [Patescibacteria group bacterium]|nr:hypothetical protein [Patescibacteria group bacterium]MCG2808877.1 hypothetical protein [Candidatus Portnoybacteria bacterium]